MSEKSKSIIRYVIISVVTMAVVGSLTALKLYKMPHKTVKSFDMVDLKEWQKSSETTDRPLKKYHVKISITLVKGVFAHDEYRGTVSFNNKIYTVYGSSYHHNRIITADLFEKGINMKTYVWGEQPILNYSVDFQNILMYNDSFYLVGPAKTVKQAIRIHDELTKMY